MRWTAPVLVAVLAGVFAASPAAAETEFYGVGAVGGVVAPVKFEATLGAAFLEGKVSKAKITCVAGTAAGEVTGATSTAHNVTRFTGCETSKLACNSTSPLGESGEIITKELEGAAGLVTATTPGIRLFAVGESGKEPKTGALAEFECGGSLLFVKVVGSVIGTLSGAAGKTPEEGKFPSSSKLSFAETAGAQKYTKFLSGECGGVGNCGPEQLTSEINGSPELGGQSVIATLKTVPFPGKLGGTI